LHAENRVGFFHFNFIKMKKNVLPISLLLVVVIMVTTGFSAKEEFDFSNIRMESESICYNVPLEKDMDAERFDVPSYNLSLEKGYVGFKEALGFKESQGRYTVINVYGYLGKYQFGRSTLEMIGVYNTSTFLQDTRLQEAAFSANISRNKWILRRDIKRFEGRYINGVKVTESGILAAAHLAGPGNVKKYLRSYGAISFEDGFGTSVGNYVKKFSGYDTSFVIANRKAKASRL